MYNLQRFTYYLWEQMRTMGMGTQKWDEPNTRGTHELKQGCWQMTHPVRFISRSLGEVHKTAETKALCCIPCPSCYEFTFLCPNLNCPQTTQSCWSPKYSGWGKKEVGLLAHHMAGKGRFSFHFLLPLWEKSRAEGLSLLTLNCTTLWEGWQG